VSEIITFLLAEDEPNDVMLIHLEFKKVSNHIQLRAVPDGAEAIRYVEGAGEYADRRRFPVPDVILLDIKMPRVDGFDFLRWLRSEAPPKHRMIPVVVMSSSNQRRDVDRAYALGANSYLVKPVDWNLFRERIKALGIYWGAHVTTPEVK